MENLKERFNAQFFENFGNSLLRCYSELDHSGFVRDCCQGLDSLELKQRIRRASQVCRQHLPQEYRAAVEVLKGAVGDFSDGMQTLICPDFVGLYGLEDYDYSIAALKFFTPFGTSELGIREFLKLDLERTLAVMRQWSLDQDHHVRRLASEGCRPRLPWSFQIPELLKNPELTRPILETLRADPELYVRRSVANHLNDISKDHPDWMLDLVEGWELSEPEVAWVVRHAARGLIKSGNPRVFPLLGFEPKPAVSVEELSLNPGELCIGGQTEFSFTLNSQAEQPQRLAVDYRIHYQKKSGRTSPKTFKLKELVLDPRQSMVLTKKQAFKNLSTRTHYPGRHRLEVFVNGVKRSQLEFSLNPAAAAMAGH